MRNNNLLDISQLNQLPPHIAKLISKPQSSPVPFSSLTPANIHTAVQYVTTKTAIDLLSPPNLAPITPPKKDQPIVLVFCGPAEDIRMELHNQAPPYVPLSYIEWLEAAGARCIPISYNVNEGSIQYLIERSHGMLLPGGAFSGLYRNCQKRQGTGPVASGFAKMFRYIQKLWARGIHYPILGICLGLELMLLTLTHDNYILSNLNSRNHQLQIYSDYDNSALLKDMPVNLRLSYQHRKLISFFHNHGISVKQFANSPKLAQKLKVVSVSRDKDGVWFGSFLEGRQNPIYLCQFHPEKQAFDWGKDRNILMKKHAIQISHYLGTSFVRQCLKCRSERAFETISQLRFYDVGMYREVYSYMKYKVAVIDCKYRDDTRDQRKKMTEKVKVSKKAIFK